MAGIPGLNIGNISISNTTSNQSISTAASSQVVLGGNSAITINSMFDIHARRLYVGGVPANVSDSAVV